MSSRPLILLFTLLFLVILTQTSWIGDDAYITMRTVDNFTNGYGLRWNVAERVQTFTHPLWMFLLSGAYLLTQNAYVSLMGLGITISLITFVLFLWLAASDTLELGLAAAIFLLSKSFVDYSTSGLENPASHLLVLLFGVYYLRNEPQTNRRIFLLSLLAGLAAFNRMDTLLLYLPALFHLLWEKRDRASLSLFLAGMAPFWLWEIFSLIYYGFPFPNTYYAKLSSGVPASELLMQGLLYFVNAFGWNPVTPVVIFSAAGWGLFSKRSLKITLLAMGVWLYLAYILSIGGDFMSGRFFSTPLVLSALLLLHHIRQASIWERRTWLAVILALGIWLSPVKSYQIEDTLLDATTGITDETGAYHPHTQVLLFNREKEMPIYDWDRAVRELKEKNTKVHINSGIGVLGYFCGPEIHIVDPLGLADPLLARLPIPSGANWRIAHFQRNIPAGYIETLEQGQMRLTNSALLDYYIKLSLVTRGEIWSAERWAAIWELNTGQAAPLLEEYLTTQK